MLGEESACWRAGCLSSSWCVCRSRTFAAEVCRVLVWWCTQRDLAGRGTVRGLYAATDSDGDAAINGQTGAAAVRHASVSSGSCQKRRRASDVRQALFWAVMRVAEDDAGGLSLRGSRSWITAHGSFYSAIETFEKTQASNFIPERLPSSALPYSPAMSPSAPLCAYMSPQTRPIHSLLSG